MAHGSNMPPIPAMFTTGNGHRMRSSAPMPSWSTCTRLDASHIELVRGTPLGVPVVPDVQQIVTTSSGPESRGGGREPDAEVEASAARCRLDTEGGEGDAVEFVEHRLDGGELIRTVGAGAGDEHPDVGRIDAVAQFVRAMLDRERHRDRAEPGARQDADDELGDVGQLDRDGCARIDAELAERCSDGVDGGIDLAPGVSQRLTGEEAGSVRRVDERDLVRPHGDGGANQSVERRRFGIGWSGVHVGEPVWGASTAVMATASSARSASAPGRSTLGLLMLCDNTSTDSAITSTGPVRTRPAR